MAVKNDEILGVVMRIDQKLDDHMLAINEKVNDLEQTIYGNGKPGLKADVASIFSVVKGISATVKTIGVGLGLIATAMGIFAGCSTLQLNNQAAIDNHEATAISATVSAISSGMGGGDADLTTPTFTPTVPPTSSIIEITPTGIVEVYTPCVINLADVLKRPPEWTFIEDCAYQPYPSQLNVRAQPGLDQKIQGRAGVQYPFNVQGYTRFGKGQVWICIEIAVDSHGAQICNGALIYRDDSGRIYGAYKKR